MERGIFAYIWRYSSRQQIVLTLFAVASFPFYYGSLQLPKLIVDQGISGKGGEFPRTYFGLEIEQITFLLTLSVAFLILVFFNGGFKYYINVYRGAVGERMLRRIRYQLVARVMRFPLSHFRKTSSGQVVSMVASETEPLGGFVGESFSVWVYQGGTLITLMAFMFVQDWKLGLAAVALYPVQAYVIPKLQRHVNALGKQRVQAVRQLSERIGETVTGAAEIHANDTSKLELADYSERLGRIFHVRFDIYRRKFFIKFLNNFLAQITPFFFYAIGGVLVILGDLSVGALVAVLAAYKDVLAPWKMLLTHYQRTADAKIKYEQLVDQFEPPQMLEEELQIADPEAELRITGRLVASNVTLAEDDGLNVVDGASLSLDLPKHVALIGPSGGGKTEFAQMMARLVRPTGGRIILGDHDFAELPEAVTGRRLSYIGAEPYLFSGSIRDNLYYGLKNRPQGELDVQSDAAEEWENIVKESENSGNSTDTTAVSWINLEAAGVSSEVELGKNTLELLRLTDLEEDIYHLGLRQTVDAAIQTDLTDAIMEVRRILRDRLRDPAIASNVELFDETKFNTNASVAENILFGTPVGEEFLIENLGENAYVLEVLDKCNLRDEFLHKGHRLAEIMVDLFQGLPPDHEFFERFSFISSDDLPEFQSTLRRIEQNGLDQIDEVERADLLALPFKLIPARHHLDLIDDEFQAHLLEARAQFRANLPEDMAVNVEFFDLENYNAASSVQDNILFGKIASERAGSAAKVGEVLADVVTSSGLHGRIIELGLNFQVGVGGARLTAAQRQKLAIVRGLIKRPDLLVLNEAMSSIDGDTQTNLLNNIRQFQNGRSLIYVPSQSLAQDNFDQVITMEKGRISDQGTAAQVEATPAPAADTDKVGGFGDEIDVLAAIPLFAGLDRSKLKLLAFASERYNYNSDQDIMCQGDYGDTAYIVLDGEVDIILETAEGPRVLVTMGRNELFGELALLCEAPRTATVRAKSDVTLLSISKDTFFKLIAEDLDTSARLTRSVADRLERTTRDLGVAAAVRDPVTNLPDIRLFNDRVRYTAARSRRFEEKSSLLCLDLENRFTDNGRAELSEDDETIVLREVANRVVACMRETDTVSRLGPRQFVIIVCPVTEANGPELLAQRITNSLAQPFNVNGHDIDLGKEYEFKFQLLDETEPDDQLDRCRSSEPIVLSALGVK